MLKKLFTLCLLLAGLFAFAFQQKTKPGFYQLKVYLLKDTSQQAQLEAYLQQAYLPALHRAGIGKVGVFKTIAPAADAAAEQKLYVFIPFKSANQFLKLEQKLQKDKQYTAAAKDYIGAAHTNPSYMRFETILLEAFTGMPGVAVPQLKSGAAERVYELRSYEAATEALHQNKVAMFNNGEIQLFDRLGFNAVFYGRVLAGAKMPNLMYMTAFENMAERDAHWKTFGADAEWKKMSTDPQYANNFLRADIYLLHPTAYSDL
jgi:hypothetical protein